MDKTDLKNNPEILGVLEASILSAHMKYFKGNLDTHYNPENEESVLYDTVVRYFRSNS